MVLGGSELEPIGNDDTSNIEGELKGDELATRGMRCCLCGPDGGDCVQDTGADSVENTS